MTKKAFIVRPFDKMLDRFCQLILERSIKDAGYEPILLNDNPQNGYIMKNIVEYLAESDICLVLVTAVPDADTKAVTLNFNVAYELGIRHALRKCGTVIVCEESQKTLIEKYAFDIRDRNIVYYSPNWLADDDDDKLCEKIKSLIKSAEQQRSDSPVHDRYTSLPADLIHTTTTDAQKQIVELTDELTRLRERNHELEEKLNQLGLDSTDENPKAVDYRQELKKALDDSIFYSDHAVAKLRELAQDKEKPEKFVEFLSDVMEKGKLDEIDCHNVMVICHRFNQGIERVFLKYASETYEYDEMKLNYADELATDIKHRDEALLIANEVIGLQKKGSVFVVTKDVTEKLLRAFFNVYLKLNKAPELLQICSVLLEKYQKTSMRMLIYQNMADCYCRLNQYDECSDACQKAIALEDNDVIHYILFHMYHDQSNYAAAFHELEIANMLDPNDSSYYKMLAGLIIDERFARTSASEDPHLIERSEVRSCALPYIIYAIDNHNMDIEEALEFLRKNIKYMKDDIPRLINCWSQDGDFMEEFSDLDYSIVEESAKTGFRTDI